MPIAYPAENMITVEDAIEALRNILYLGHYKLDCMSTMILYVGLESKYSKHSKVRGLLATSNIQEEVNFNPSVPDGQIAAFRSLKSDCTKLKHRRIS